MLLEVKIEGTDWDFEHELGSVDEDLRLISDKCRADETKKMVNAIEVRRVSVKPQRRAKTTG